MTKSTTIAIMIVSKKNKAIGPITRPNYHKTTTMMKKKKMITWREEGDISIKFKRSTITIKRTFLQAKSLITINRPY